jgi:predicted Zn-dependent protease
MRKVNMKKFFLIFLLIATVAFAQSWEKYTSEEFNIQFEVPGTWQTTTDVESDIPFLEAVSPDETMVLMVYAYKNADISTKDLLSQAVNDLDMALTGEMNEEDINGLNAWVAEATGMINELKVGMFIMAATYDENNYVAYVFTEEKDFTKNSGVMNKILDSFKPLR